MLVYPGKMKSEAGPYHETDGWEQGILKRRSAQTYFSRVFDRESVSKPTYLDIFSTKGPFHRSSNSRSGLAFRYLPSSTHKPISVWRVLAKTKIREDKRALKHLHHPQ